MPSYIIGITKSGYNVLTETDINNFIFHSDYNTLKYYANGSVRINGSWTTNPGDSVKKYTTSLYHGLGYVPLISCYISVQAGDYNIVPEIYSVMTVGQKIASVWVDSTHIHFEIQLYAGIWANDWTFDTTFYYKIFKNKTGL